MDRLELEIRKRHLYEKNRRRRGLLINIDGTTRNKASLDDFFDNITRLIDNFDEWVDDPTYLEWLLPYLRALREDVRCGTEYTGYPYNDKGGN